MQPHPVQDKIMSIAEKRRAFRALHQSGCFVIPNPWNVGSARYMQGLGFKALATTSAGYAHSIGYADGDVTRDMMLAHYREIRRRSRGSRRQRPAMHRHRRCRTVD